jgi:hypothetical protein
MLHCDVSVNHVIIMDTEKKDDPMEILIDFDLARELDSCLNRASHQTGTMKFMAIEVLEGKAHTYHYDI